MPRRHERVSRAHTLAQLKSRILEKENVALIIR